MNRRDFMTGALAAGALSPLLARPGLAATQSGTATSPKTTARPPCAFFLPTA